MNRLVVGMIGMKKEFVENFIQGLQEIGVKICGEPFEVSGIWNIIYMPFGNEQKQKCEKYIEYRCNNNLM